MCGISAVYGDNAPIKAMILTLNQLERGTQGCGVAYMCNSRLEVIKEPIHPVKFMDRHLYRLNVNTRLAIAHKRMPSVGKVAYRNTHPFVSCDWYFALAHNGHSFLGGIRKWLIKYGHRFQGETDSEVLTHVLEELTNEQGDMFRALRELVIDYLSGAVVVLTCDGEILAGKSGYQPLHYAVAGKEVYIASTEYAVKKLLKLLDIKEVEVVSVEDGEVIRVKGGYIDHLEVEKPKRAKFEDRFYYWAKNRVSYGNYGWFWF